MERISAVALAIQSGRVSWVLTRLNSYSRRNKIYRAFRELGRVYRTIYLLRWIDDAELRRSVTHEANDVSSNWRVVYRIDDDAVVILEVFAKKTRATPDAVIKTCSKRLKEYDDAAKQEKKARGKGLESRKCKRLS